MHASHASCPFANLLPQCAGGWLSQACASGLVANEGHSFRTMQQRRKLQRHGNQKTHENLVGWLLTEAMISFKDMTAREQAQTFVAMSGFPMPFLP